MMLCMVRRREVQPSLWNGIMMLVFGSLSRYILCLQLELKEEGKAMLDAHSGCEGELGIALESLQGKRDLI